MFSVICVSRKTAPLHMTVMMKKDLKEPKLETHDVGDPSSNEFLFNHPTCDENVLFYAAGVRQRVCSDGMGFRERQPSGSTSRRCFLYWP